MDSRSTSAWFPGLISGAIFAVCTIPIFWLFHQENIGIAAGSGLFGAIVIGTSAGRTSARANRRALAAGGEGMSQEGLRQAQRASRRGPVPADPGVRAAAADLAAGRLERRTRQGNWPGWVLGGMAVVCVVMGVADSPRWFGGTVIMAAVAVQSRREPRVMAERLTTLTSGRSDARI